MWFSTGLFVRGMYTYVHIPYNQLMLCPFCQSSTSVQISRPSKKTLSVWRRRQCGKCRKVFSTREKPDLLAALTVKRQNKPDEPFSEGKLLLCIHGCLSHRKDALEASRALSDTVIRLLLPCSTGDVESKDIREIVSSVLKRFDKAAATYYKAHHKNT